MCGRYAQGRAIPSLIERYVAMGAQLIAEQQGLRPTFNAAPGTAQTVVYADGGEVLIGPMQWGFVPRWARSLDQVKMKPINAQSEKAESSPFFRDAFRNARCLVPAQGFYEWKGAKAPKQPYCIHTTDQELFSFAGLWSRFEGAEGHDLLTFAVLTTDANEVVRDIHTRMPCILRREDEEQWLNGDGGDIPGLKSLLRPYPAALTAAYPVSTRVNKPGNDGPELAEYVSMPEPSPEAGQAELF